MLEWKVAVSLLEQIPDRRRDALLETAFMELAIADLDQALALAKSLDPTPHPSALRGILQGSERVSLDDGLREIGAQQGDVQAVTDRIALSRINSGVDVPFSKWVRLLKEYGNDIASLSQAQIQLLARVAKVWTEKSGMDALQPIFLTVPSDASRIALMSKLMQDLNEFSPELVLEVAEWIKVRDLEVLAEALADWAEMDPQIALEFAIEVESSEQRFRIQRSVISAWIQKDPNQILEELEQLPVRLQHWSRYEALREMTKTTPELVPAWLQGIDDASSKENIFVRLVSNWAEHDPHAALRWIQSDPYAQEKSPQMMDELMENLAQVDPSYALEVALDYPSDDSYPGLEATVIIETTRVDVERGIAMLKSARNQVTLEYAQIGVGIALVKQGEIDRAIALSANMSDEFQGRYFSELAVPWASADLESLLEQLDSLQSEEVRTSIVQELLLRNGLVQTLTTAQLNTLRNYLSE